MKYPREWIDSVRERSDIVELIGSYVTLRRAGSNYTGLCPFHSERTPSFTVFPDTQSFFCFGCEAGGDAFTFVMRSENLEYPEAVEFLAKRAGIQIPETHEDSDQPRGISRARAYELNRAAARFYRDCLFDPAIGEAGMNYLRDTRGLDTAVIRHFGLGYAPNEFGVLLPHLKSLGFTEEEMRQCFLCGRSQSGRYYDYFRGRVMFPVINTAGEVVAFSGRDVTGTSKAKYLNSSDTPVFQKRKNLFALNFAKAHCAEQMILCEGNMDVVSMHAAGFENAVASLGTALTDEQARIMARYTKRVVISYDSDAPGQKAANRAIGILGEVGLDVRVLRIEGAKDPDEFIKKYGADKFRQQLSGSFGKFDFNMDGILARHNIALPDEKIKACTELANLVAGIYSSAEREVYIAAAAKKLDIPAESLRADVERLMRKKKSEYKKEQSKKVLRQSAGYGDRVNPDYAKNIAAAKAEEAVLGMLLLYPEHREAVRTGKVKLSAADFFTDFGRRVFEAVEENDHDGSFTLSVLGQFFTPEEEGRITRMQLSRSALSDNGAAVFADNVSALRRERAEVADSENGVDGILELIREKRNT